MNKFDKFCEKCSEALDIVCEFFIDAAAILIWLILFIIAIALIIAGTIGIPAGYITMIVFICKGTIAWPWLFTIIGVPVAMLFALTFGKSLYDDLLDR